MSVKGDMPLGPVGEERLRLLRIGRLRCLVVVVHGPTRRVVDVAGDEAVLAGLYVGLRRFAAAVGPIEVEPEDLVQEALVRALARGPLTELDDPGAYLRTTIVRLAANHRRSLGRKRRAMGLLDRKQEGASHIYPSDLAVLGELAPPDRAVVYLAVIEGASATEIGKLLGWSAARVRVRKHRALGRLRLVMEVSDA